MRQATNLSSQEKLLISLFQNSINLKGANWKKTRIKHLQKQPPRGAPRKRCSENMQQIYRGTPTPKCDFNKVALQLY